MHRHTKALSMAIGAAVLSQASLVNAVEVSFSGETSYTNNATRDSANKIDERRDDVSVGVTHEAEWANSKLGLAYNLSHSRFSENTQSDTTSLAGDLSFTREVANARRAINLSHSAALINTSGTADGRLDQTLQRHQLHADVDQMFAQRGVHSFSAKPSLDISIYPDDKDLNSTRYGLAGTWTARIDSIATAGATVQAQRINYKVADDSNQYTATAFYRRNLRKLQYGIEAGLQRRTQTGSDITSPYLSVNGSYQAGAHALSLSLRNQITDTSTGTALRSDEGELVATGTAVEQLVQRELRLTHSYNELCDRCDNSTSLALSQQDYETATANDSNSLRLSHNFGYKLSELATASVGLALAKTSFDNAPDNDFTETVLDLGYSRQITREFSLRAYAQHSNRNSDTNTADFTESRIGVGIAYSFM